MVQGGYFLVTGGTMLTRTLSMLIMAALAAGCAGRQQSTPPYSNTEPIGGAPQPVEVVDSMEPVRAAFNATADRPRVLLLVSPVCSECVFGAQVVRASILD